jgi:hypothetical protein
MFLNPLIISLAVASLGLLVSDFTWFGKGYSKHSGHG